MTCYERVEEIEGDTYQRTCYVPVRNKEMNGRDPRLFL